MASYFSHIYSGYTTSGVGTETLPFTCSQLSDFLNGTTIEGVSIQDNDIICIRSNLETSAIDLFKSLACSNVTLKAWNLEEYGLWRLSDTTTSATVDLTVNHSNRNITIEDLFVNNAEINNYYQNIFYNFRNCVFYNDFTEQVDISGANQEFLGCTFINGIVDIDDYTSLNNGTCSFLDCVFIGSTFIIEESTIALSFSNCMFSGTSATVFDGISTSALSFSACTFGWTPATTFQNVSGNPTYLSDVKENYDYRDFGLSFDYSTSARTRWIANDIQNGWGPARKGTGCFWFDPNIYVDFDSSTSGNGTSATPFTYDNLYSYLHTNSTVFSGDNFLIKGSKQTSAAADLSPLTCLGTLQYEFNSWDPENNGPWRIKSTNGFYVGDYHVEDVSTSLNNGIIQGNGLGVWFFGNSELNDMHVIGDSYGICFTSSFVTRITAEINGTNLIALSASTHQISVGLHDFVANDSILQTSAFDSTGGDYVLNNCVTSSPNLITLSGTVQSVSATNMQYGWSPPTWPDWNDTDKNNWKYTILGKDITIPGSENW